MPAVEHHTPKGHTLTKATWVKAKTRIIIIPQSTVSWAGKIHNPIKTFHKVKGWIRPAFRYHFPILMRLCPRLYSSLWLFHWAALADWLCFISQLRAMTSDSSLSEREDTSAPTLTSAVTVRGRWFVTTTFCLYASLLLCVCSWTSTVHTQQLRLWGYQTPRQVPPLLCSPKKKWDISHVHSSQQLSDRLRWRTNPKNTGGLNCWL